MSACEYVCVSMCVLNPEDPVVHLCGPMWASFSTLMTALVLCEQCISAVSTMCAVCVCVLCVL